MDGPATGDLAYFLDFDLGVLGSDPAGYTAYAAAIRLEYQCGNFDIILDHVSRGGLVMYVLPTHKHRVTHSTYTLYLHTLPGTQCLLGAE